MRCLFTWCLPSSRWRKRILSDSGTRKMCRRTWTCQWPEIQNYTKHGSDVRWCINSSYSHMECNQVTTIYYGFLPSLVSKFKPSVNMKIWGGQYNLQLTVFTLIDGQLIHMQGNCRLRVQEIAILMYFWLGLMEIDKPSGKYFSFVRIIFHTKENIVIQILQEFNMELWKCFEKWKSFSVGLYSYLLLS